MAEDPAATERATALAEAAVGGDRLALARLLTAVENRTPVAEAALRRLYPMAGRAHLVGITGPPGAGKSTLVAALLAEVRAAGRPVAVVAVHAMWESARGGHGFGLDDPGTAAAFDRYIEAYAAKRGRFFTGAERKTLGALVESVFPADADPGAAKLGVVDYVEQLLTAFDHSPARIYAGGPYSGRNPFIDYDRGRPSKRRPKNRFKRFVEPTRLQSLYWRWQILGTNDLTAEERKAPKVSFT